MAFDYEVHTINPQRIALVSFQRAVTGPPKLNHPDIDNRGYFDTTGNGIARGPVVGVTEGDTVIIKLKRERISENADLYVKSSDPSVMTVTNMVGTDSLPWSESLRLKITGVRGSGGVSPKTAEIQVLYGDKKVVIGAMTVWVFSKLEVSLTLHSVEIKGKDGGGGYFPELTHIDAAFEMVKAVWQPCGISFKVVDNEVKSRTVTFGRPGELFLHSFKKDHSGTHIDELFRGDTHSTKSINIYFVYKIIEVTSGPGRETAGMGVDPFRARDEYKINPGILVGTKNKTASKMAGIMAHEIGHFFRLSHIDDKQSKDPLQDAWSKRMLMYPSADFEISGSMVTDVGYGKEITGAMITMKDLSDLNNSKNHSNDGEWRTVRVAASNPDTLYVVK